MTLDNASKNKRLFIAIELPPHARGFLSSLHKPITGAKWTALDNPHLTLRFIGNIEPDAINAMIKRLEDIKLSEFCLDIDRLGLFKRPGRSVLWAGLKPCAELTHLKQEIDFALQESIGLEPEDKRFHPHITLARIKKPVWPELDAYVKQNIIRENCRFKADGFILFKSQLSASGAKHTPLAIFPANL